MNHRQALSTKPAGFLVLVPFAHVSPLMAQPEAEYSGGDAELDRISRKAKAPIRHVRPVACDNVVTG